MENKQHLSFRLLTISTLLALLAQSCVMYHPVNTDIPLLEGQGDLHIDGSVSMTFPLMAHASGNATVSYAPLPLLGTQVSGNFTEPDNYFFKGALGLYTPFKHSVLEAWFGAGHGYAASGSYVGLDNQHRAVGGPYDLFFTQVDYGWNRIGGGTVDLAIGVRCGVLKPNYVAREYDEENNPRIIDSFDSEVFTLEPLAMIRFGGERLKININIASAIIADWPTENNRFNYERFSIGLGINYHLPPRHE